VLLAVERVAVLRHLDMFSHTPGRVLAGLAHVLEEVDFPAGAELMATGAREDWMFVVAEGEVEVRREDRTVRMRAVCVVGELAVLDPLFRSATVTAVTAVRTLRLRKAAFDEAIRLQPEIARGVIVELVRMLRETHEPRSLA
jgi:CRP-like cAMP-binding protein